MATRIGTNIIADGSIGRPDINTDKPGSALITKVVQGSGISITSTGADSGTGDVTVSVTSVPWSGVSGRPTTLSGYGITDALPMSIGVDSSGVGSIHVISQFIKSGTPLFGDSEFASGTNSVYAYNNLGNGSVVLTREANATAPNSSKFVIKVEKSAVAASPGLGGVYQSFITSANQTYGQLIVAKIPVGYSIGWASNSFGTGGSQTFTGSTAGTGKWETYIRIIYAGDTGSFSSSGHFYLIGAAGAVTWYVAAANVYIINGEVGTGIQDYQMKSVSFTKLLNKPTTLVGYGITDAYSKTQTDLAIGTKAPLSHTQDFSTITNTPTTLTGYGITDALGLTAEGKVNGPIIMGGVPGSNIVMDDGFIFLRGNGDHNYSVRYAGVGREFDTLAQDGPVFTGKGGGILGTRNGSTDVSWQLKWSPTGVDVKYGITSAGYNVLTENTAYKKTEVDTLLSDKASTSHAHTFAEITSKPTTISGYGITDAYTKAEMFNSLAGKSDINHTHAFSTITARPTTVSGYGITDAYTKSEINTALGQKSDSGHTHAFSEITSKPTTISGYGITDASLSTHTHSFSTITSKPTTLSGYSITDAYTKVETDNKLSLKSDSNHVHTFASITSTPTTLSGYGITDSYTKAQNDASLAGKSDVFHTHAFSVITNKPTTLAGYGITDASLNTHTHAFSAITSRPTTVDGYGITDAVKTYGNNVLSAGNFTLTDGHFITTQPIASGGWARGLMVKNSAGVTVGGTGSLGAGTNVTGFYLGSGETPWATKNVLVDFITGNTTISNDLTVLGAIKQGTKAVSLEGHTQPFNTITGLPSTLAGHGITDAYTAAAVQSRGMNLVTNGTGLMGNNYNFSQFTFYPADTYVGGGSFMTDVPSAAFANDELIPVLPDNYYKLKMYLKSVDMQVNNVAYGMVVCYDVDGMQINPAYYTYYDNVTTLTQPLKLGDTEVFVSSVGGWDLGTDAGRYLKIHRYKNGKGFVWGPKTYSRNTMYKPFNNTGIDAVNNKVTLVTPWSIQNPEATDKSWPIGTPIGTCYSGGTYLYPTNVGNKPIPDDKWTLAEGVFGGLSTTGGVVSKQFPVGTAFVKVGGLFNRMQDSSAPPFGIRNKTLVSGIYLTEITSESLTSGEPVLTSTQDINGVQLTFNNGLLTKRVGSLVNISDAQISNMSWTKVLNKPTTLASYGVTDAYTKAQVDSITNTKLSLDGGTLTGNIEMTGDYKSLSLGAGINFFFFKERSNFDYAMRYAGPGNDFDGVEPDGPTFTGRGGGLLGTRQGTGASASWQLKWSTTGVDIKNTLTAGGFNVLTTDTGYTKAQVDSLVAASVTGYTKAEVDTIAAGKLSLNGGDITGTINMVGDYHHIAMGSSGRNYLFLKEAGNYDYVMRYSGFGSEFDGTASDGPIFIGRGGGMFGTRQGTGASASWQLKWTKTGVDVKNTLTAGGFNVLTTNTGYTKPEVDLKLAGNTSIRPPKVLLPFYVYPSNAYTNPDYNNLIEIARKFPGVEINVILNNSNGPGAAIDGNYTAVIKRLRATGNIRILGYIDTSTGTKSAANVKTEIDTWTTWYSPDGIFMDKMSNENSAPMVAYYADLTNYIHSKGMPLSIGNPGTAQLPMYFEGKAADVICIFENTYVPDEPYLKGDFAGGYADYPTSSKAVLVSSQAAFSPMSAKLLSKYAGMWYINSQTPPVLWNSVPTYLEEMLTWMQSYGNVAPPTTPSLSRFYTRNDFVDQTNDSPEWDITTSGSAASTTTGINPDYTNSIGVLTFASGSTSSGRVSAGVFKPVLMINSGVCTTRTILALPRLASPTTGFAVRTGLMTDAFNDTGYGAYFRYSETSGGKWQAVVLNNGSATVLDTGVVAVHSVMWKFEIVTQPLGDIKFYINGSLVAASSLASIPTTAACGYGTSATKTAGTTAAYILDLDLMDVEVNLTNPR